MKGIEKIDGELGKANMQFILNELKLDSELLNLSFKIASVEHVIYLLNIKSKEINIKTNDLIELINLLKEDLIDIYRELKKLKKDMLAFKNYQGIFRNLMCKNTEYKEEKNKEKECDNFLYSNKNISK